MSKDRKLKQQSYLNKVYNYARRYAKRKAAQYNDRSLIWAFHAAYSAGMIAGHEGKGK